MAAGILVADRVLVVEYERGIQLFQVLQLDPELVTRNSSYTASGDGFGSIDSAVSVIIVSCW